MSRTASVARFIGLPVCLVLGLAACGDPATTTGSSTAAASAPAPKSASAAKPRPSAAPVTKPVVDAPAEMADTDLSSRGDEWKGITIKAPKDAKIMEDLGDARVAVKGFDVVLSQKKERSDVAERKKDLEKLAKTLKGKVTFSNETADGFDYKMEQPKMDKPEEMFARESFFMVVKLGDKLKVGCFPHDSAGADETAKAREACKTVAKSDGAAPAGSGSAAASAGPAAGSAAPGVAPKK